MDIHFADLFDVIIECLNELNCQKSNQLKQRLLDSSFVFYLYWCLSLCDVLETPYLAFQRDDFIGLELNDYVLSLKVNVCVFFSFYFLYHKICLHKRL